MTPSVERLINDALAMESESALEAGALGFMARAMVQATLPHKQVAVNEFERRNGNYSLSIMAPSSIGLPYGTIPRLLLAWLTTEAVKTKSRELELGDSLSGFMAELDMMPTGGRWGSITRLKDQTTRLFSSMIQCSYTTNDRHAVKSIVVADESDLWWSPSSPGQHCLVDSTVKLSQPFYDEIINNPVPVDMRALQALRTVSYTHLTLPTSDLV